jgi:hypothetical protein
MTDQHTPGPWRWVPEPDTASLWRDYGDLYSASSEVVLSIWDNGFDGGVRVNSHADARLIEAAPELLQEVEWLLDAYIDAIRAYAVSFKRQPNPEDDRDVIRIRALIAKVRGTQ